MVLEDKMKIWNDEEVKVLFGEVENCKHGQTALKNAFCLHAKKYKRKPNSVRNYYYHEVENLKNDGARCKKLNIDLSKHGKTYFENFDKTEENDLLKKIENLTMQGISVRSACLKLSDGDLTKMTRYQNKYQNMKKKVEENGKIIPFKQKQKMLTESDINSLFMGLVKLIKKTALDDFMEKSKIERQSSNYLLKKAFLDLNQKDKQIAELRKDFEILKSENEKLQSELINLNSDKRNALKKHLSKKNFDNIVEN